MTLKINRQYIAIFILHYEEYGMVFFGYFYPNKNKIIINNVILVIFGYKQKERRKLPQKKSAVIYCCGL